MIERKTQRIGERKKEKDGKKYKSYRKRKKNGKKGQMMERKNKRKKKGKRNKDEIIIYFILLSEKERTINRKKEN